MKKIISLYGQPVCGKTTQALLLQKNYGFSIFGMGETLRAEIASGSKLGQKIKPAVDAGLLIPDECMEQIISNAGEKANEVGLVFDGFPRMVSQAEMLKKVTAEAGLKSDAFIYLRLDAPEALRRIKNRAALGQAERGDDLDEQAIKNRFAAFEKQSVPLLDYYRKQNKLHEIDGSLSIEGVYEEIVKTLRAKGVL